MKKTTLFVLVVLTVLCALFVSCSAENDGTQVINLSVDGLVRSKAAAVTAPGQISVPLTDCTWTYKITCNSGLGWASSYDGTLAGDTSVMFSIGEWTIYIKGYTTKDESGVSHETIHYEGTAKISVTKDSVSVVSGATSGTYTSGSLVITVKALKDAILVHGDETYLNGSSEIFTPAPVGYIKDNKFVDENTEGATPLTVSIKWELASVPESGDPEFSDIWTVNKDSLVKSAGAYKIRASVVGSNGVVYGDSVTLPVTFVNGYTYTANASILITSTSIGLSGVYVDQAGDGNKIPPASATESSSN